MITEFQTKNQASLLSRMRSLAFGKRWRKAGEGTSGKNETDCSGKRRILRKRVKRISEKAEAYCLEKRIILRKRERRISEDEEVDCLEKRNGVTWERVHSGSENAARCICWRSTLHRLAQRAASAIAPHCVFRPNWALRGKGRASRGMAGCRQAPMTVVLQSLWKISLVYTLSFTSSRTVS